MKIGIFDSGLGGLVIAKSIIHKLPEYDYAYLGDTKNVPYGSKSQKKIYTLTRRAVAKLLGNNCKLVIVACNTASTNALRKIQREFLPKYFPDRRVLGVIIPTLETIDSRHTRIGVIGTTATIKSGIYKKELKKLWPKAKIFQVATPKLVPIIENGQGDELASTLENYLRPLKQQSIDTLVLGCTHYPLIKNQAQKILGLKVKIISQTDIIPRKLKNYLSRHPEVEKTLNKNRLRIFQVTKFNKNYETVSQRLFEKKLNFKITKI